MHLIIPLPLCAAHVGSCYTPTIPSISGLHSPYVVPSFRSSTSCRHRFLHLFPIQHPLCYPVVFHSSYVSNHPIGSHLIFVIISPRSLVRPYPPSFALMHLWKHSSTSWIIIDKCNNHIKIYVWRNFQSVPVFFSDTH